MSALNTRIIIISLAVLIGAALLYVRVISNAFVLGTDTFSHPYKSFVAALVLAGLAWMLFIPLFKRAPKIGTKALYILIAMGVALRLLFLGSTPIYEDDWNRYLWDGAVVIEGYNPYLYSPDVTFKVGQDAPRVIKDLQALSGANRGITKRINNPHLTTIYPPVAMSVFALAGILKPFDLNALRGIYLIIDGLSLWLLIKALSLYGRNQIWALLYWFNPMLIYSVYNAAHMDIILVPFLLSMLVLVKTRPLLAGVALGLAGAVKFWPLVLGPVLLRHYRSRIFMFVGAGVIAGITALLLTLPMLLALTENSGLSAYSIGWQRSSFLFGYIESTFGILVSNYSLLARISIAFIISSLSIYFAFKRNIAEENLPALLMLIPLCLFLLSPTGYPWYVLWFLPFLPFIPLYGAGLLTVTVTLYYLRYAMGERDIYDFYTSAVVPFQFGLPIVILIIEGLRMRRKRHG